MAETLSNRIEIACSPERLYDYVTQPWRWHEWHPASLSASRERDVLTQGDQFDEVVEIRPLSALPLRLRRQCRYTVITARRPEAWEALAVARDSEWRVSYQFEPTATGVAFTRRLTYEVTGMTRWLLPLLRPLMRSQSLLALANLDARLASSEPTLR